MMTEKENEDITLLAKIAELNTQSIKHLITRIEQLEAQVDMLSGYPPRQPNKNQKN